MEIYHMYRKQPSARIWLHLILQFALLTNLIACSLGRHTNRNATATLTSTDMSLSGVESSGSVVITFAGYEYERQLYEPLMAEFHQQNPDITVQFVALPEYSTQAQDSSGNYPRLLASSADAVTTYVFGLDASAYFSDLTPLIEADPTFQPDDFWPGLLTACQEPEGQMIGIPLGVIPLVIYYNSTSFDLAELPYPAPGWTWADFQRDITALAHTQGGQVDYGFVDSTDFFASVLVPLVDGYLVSTGGKIESAAIKDQVQSYLDLAHTGSLFPFTGTDESRTALFQGKAPPMWIGGLEDPSPVNSDQLARQSYGLAPFPVAGDGSVTHTTPQFPICGFISSGSAHKREAWAWLHFLTRQKLDRTIHSNNQIPARISVADQTRFWDAFPAQTVPALKYGLAHGWYGSRYPQILKQIGAALSKAITERADLDLMISQLSGLTIPDTPTPNVVTPVTVATPQPTASNSEDIVTVNYSPPLMPPNDTTFKKLAEEFNRLHPEIVVNVSNNTDCTAGSVSGCLDLKYDCFTANLYGDKISQLEDGLYNLDPFIDAEDPTLLNDFFPGLTAPFSAGGKLFALPASAQMPLVYYNKDILVQKGINPPSGSWTVNDFLSLATTAASGGGPGILTIDDFRAEAAAGPAGSGENQIFGAAQVDVTVLDFMAKGWVDYSVDPPVVNLNQPQVIHAVKQVTDLIKEGVFLYSNATASDAILTGRVAFWFDIEDISTGFSIFPATINMGIAPIPQGIETIFNTVDAASLRPWKGHYISRKTKNPQACWQWISFLSADPSSFIGVPVRRSVAASANWEARVGAENAAVYRAALSEIPLAKDYEWSDYFEAYNSTLPIFLHNIIGKIVLGGGDPQAVIEEEQQDIDEYLACIAPIDLSSETTTPGVFQKILDCQQKADPYGDQVMFP
jgi:ABC-type glycerol-3-phosphate transport system substrate-binding protein